MYLEFDFLKLWIEVDDLGITAIHYVDAPLKEPDLTDSMKKHLDLAKKELTAYFNGKPIQFTVPLHLTVGTDFQKNVWRALIDIPYGEIRNYQEIAQSVNSPKAQQAVGQANKKNPIPIIIPCHRVTAKNGTLGGYMGNSTNGALIKEFLLNLEHKTYSK